MSASPTSATPRGSRGVDDPSEQPPSRSIVPAWVWWALLVGTFLWNAWALLAPSGSPAVSLPYSTFLAQVRAGNVASVTIAGQDLSGTFQQPTTIPTEPAATPTTGAGPTTETAGTPTPTTTGGDDTATYTAFTTVLPPFGDDNLLPLLEQQAVTVSVEDTSGGSWLVDLLINVLPTVLFLGVLALMARRAQRGQQGLFGLGSSRARVYDQERPGVTFADVAGEDEAKGELAEVVDFLKRPDRYRALGARLPRGVLLVGPPGTGKTLLARAVAGEARVPFFNISGSEFVEMIVGVGASRVRDLFAKAKAGAPAIIFVDEIDAIGRQRGGSVIGGNDEREQTLNQLLVEMDGFDDRTNVIVIAATNRPDVLDAALLRPGRFDRRVTLGFPERAGRAAILRVHTRRLRLGADVDPDNLARRTPGFSGADLANLANEAALAAARRGGDVVTPRDFDEALDKIILGTRQARILTDAERRLVAYHEGGHALVARFTPGADPVNKVTIIPHGRALGVTEQLAEDDRHNYPRAYLLGRLAGMLGGRAAEDLVFDQPTTGAESDLEQATGLARRMVARWGMSEELGLAVYNVGDAQSFLGPSVPEARDYAEATAAAMDRAVRTLLDRAYGRAREILERERPLLDALAGELIAHETIDAQRLEVLLAARPVAPRPPTGG